MGKRAKHHDTGERVVRLTTALLAFLLTLAGPAATAVSGSRPRLDLRVTPRMSFSPVQIMVVAELVGGEECEEFYCPGLEWEWDDGARSIREADCVPFQPGMELERRFSARHAYAVPGEYRIRVTLRRASRSVAVATALVTVQPGVGSGL